MLSNQDFRWQLVGFPGWDLYSGHPTAHTPSTQLPTRTEAGRNESSRDGALGAHPKTAWVHSLGSTDFTLNSPPRAKPIHLLRCCSHRELKLFSLYSAASQALPCGLRKKFHQKSINLLIWVPTAFLNRIPKLQARSLSPAARPHYCLWAWFPWCCWPEPWAEL